MTETVVAPETQKLDAQIDQSGAYRRALSIEAIGGNVSVAMEDDVHHFELVLKTDGTRVQDIRATALRTPWKVCAGALAELQTLANRSIDDLVELSVVSKAEQCLHLMDLVLIAANHVRDNHLARIYRIEVDLSPPAAVARMWRDGEPLMSWEIVDGILCGSGLDGLRLATLPKHVASLDPDDREATLILRRAAMISNVRRFDLDRFEHADELNPVRSPTCFAQQPTNRPDATRNLGASRNFWREGTWPLSHGIGGHGG